MIILKVLIIGKDYAAVQAYFDKDLAFSVAAMKKALGWKMMKLVLTVHYL
jgi:hypothetical protein